MLILELTQKCNLSCKYCCYSTNYPRFRSHGQSSLSLEIAELAVARHLDAPCSNRVISFYGGEPLLEFEILKKIVSFAENHCIKNSKSPPSFSLTTNGTLLTDDVLHFLVEHQFCILISIDGDKQSHDQNRIFRETGAGSFDVIEQNINRFIELYPKYDKRGIITTLTADNDFYSSNVFMRRYKQYFPVLIVNYVSDDVEIDAKSKQYCSNTFSCAASYCDNQKIIPFVNWTIERQDFYDKCFNMFYSQLTHSVENAKNDWPIFWELFIGNYRQIHQRTLKNKIQYTVACSCIPGAVRLYCNTEGNYYPCEKVETSDALCIGNVWSGIDSKKVQGLIEYLGEHADCNNCKGKFLCGICPTSITEGKKNETDTVLIRKTCEETLARLPQYLQKYTDIMEMMPSLLDDIYANVSHGNDWLEDVLFLVSTNQNCHKAHTYEK